MTDIIEKYYIKNKYPNLDRLYNYLKDDDIRVTKKQVKEFLDAQASKQITQQRRVYKSEGGHITAISKNELWQIDQFFLSKYYKTNRNYKYIFCAIDVFTRYVYCIPLKNKNNDDVINALKKILKYDSPQKIISDSDSVFLSNKFQALMNDYDIIHDTVPINDHESLGIIDRFARTLKQRLTNLFIGNNSTNWIDHLEDVVKDYNNTKNKGILDIKPNKANLPENNQLLLEFNKLKSIKNNIVSDLNVGDKVRIYIKKSMEKGTEPQFSNNIYTVENIKGKTITLDNGDEKRRKDLLLVPHGTIDNNDKNIIRKATRDYKIEQTLKRDGINNNNILINKRERKKTLKQSL
jgi:ribosomal protein L21E/transposase InsO family protein